MAEITTIEAIQQLILAGESDWKQYGEVRSDHWENLILFNYTTAATFAQRWNYFERVSRGLIIDTTTGDIIARPFDKFFGWGEEPGDPASHLVEITEKLDGSLGILLRQNGQFFVATRGAFRSEQAQWATRYLRHQFDLKGLPDEFTLLFEIIYPENRIVVDYGTREDLVLIGVRNRFTGEDYFHTKVTEIAAQYGFNLAPTHKFNAVEEVIEAAKGLEPHREGWVVRYSNGQRFKIKGSAYKTIQKVMIQASFRHVLQSVIENRFDMLIEGIPDEFLKDIRGWKAEIDTKTREITEQVQVIFAAAPKANRKEFAAWVTTNHPDKATYLFALIDDRDLTALIYRLAFKETSDSGKQSANTD